MIKVKWLYSELPIPLSELSKLMKDHQYTEGAGSGFLISTSTSTSLIGKYIEKTIQKSIIEDPFGSTSEIESINYYTCRFNWSSDSNYMFISEPPRSLRKFSNRLHSITNLGLVLSEVNVYPDRWLEIIEESADIVKVIKISSYGIRISHNSTAKVSVTGTQDVRTDHSKLIADKRYKVDSISFEAQFESLLVKGELTKSGSCKLKSSNAGFILEKLRHSLERASVNN